MAIPELASADLADGGGCRMMRRYRLRPLLSAFALLTACPVAAQEWDFQLTPYLWGADIDGRAEIGDVGREFGIDFSDLVDLLAGAALVRFEAGTDRHAFMADLVWLDLEPEDEPATIGGVAEANFKSTTLELNYFYKLDALQLDFGVRYWDMDVEIDPALLPAVRRGDDWVDGFIGVRLIGELGRTWNWQARLNVGAGGSDAAPSPVP